MMNLFEMLSNDSKDLMVKYIETYSDGNLKTDLENILQPWVNDKQTMFNLLGKKLMLTKTISCVKDENMLIEDLYEICCGFNAKGYYFKKKFMDFAYEHFGYGDNCWNVRRLMSDEALINNKYDGDNFSITLPNGKELKIQKGCKVTKVLGKIANAFNIDGFEEFRILHSQVLNQKTLTGQLTISIHPLDFMTMSDNDCGWSSCMSWIEDGCYRRGTVEMMTSPCVVVAYLNSSSPFEVCGHKWTNKKWRSLYIVDKDVLSDVKAYPYQNETLNTIVMDWLKELAQTNLNWEYDDKAYNLHVGCYETHDNKLFGINFETNTMYNDCHYQHCFINKELLKNKEISINVNYSGESVCMNCGTTHGWYDCEADLSCNDCSETLHCAHCNRRISENENTYEVHGEQICECCFDDNIITCPICDEYEDYDDSSRVYLAKDSEHIYERIYFRCCSNCITKNEFTLFNGKEVKLINIPKKYSWEIQTKYILEDSLTEEEKKTLFNDHYDYIEEYNKPIREDYFSYL